jgi:hypothetical protein
MRFNSCSFGLARGERPGIQDRGVLLRWSLLARAAVRFPKC